MKTKWYLYNGIFVVFVLLYMTTVISAATTLSVETLDSSDQPERVFKSGDDVPIRVVVKNTDAITITGNLRLQIKDENDNLIETLSSQYISLAPNEQRIIKATWNSGNYAEWLSPGGFTFIGKKFKVSATFSTSSSSFDFYVDEFGLDRSLRSINYYSMQKDWWEEVGSHVKARGGDVRQAWRNEWETVISKAKATGANVLDIGMHWYSYGDDEGCILNFGT